MMLIRSSNVLHEVASYVLVERAGNIVIKKLWGEMSIDSIYYDENCVIVTN